MTPEVNPETSKQVSPEAEARLTARHHPVRHQCSGHRVGGSVGVSLLRSGWNA